MNNNLIEYAKSNIGAKICLECTDGEILTGTIDEVFAEEGEILITLISSNMPHKYSGLAKPFGVMIRAEDVTMVNSTDC